MDRNLPVSENCCGSGTNTCSCGSMGEMLPLQNSQEEEIACCGSLPGPASSPDEHPGYRICPFVSEFRDSPVGRIPKVKTALEITDRIGTIRARMGFGRNSYKISPGLYCVGEPDADSPVLVTGNYKLSFDVLRQSLKGADAWILIADTRGINVWCAAGKGTFSTQEVIARVKSAGLEKVVRHRKLILPQLSATGVSAQKVRKGCGFEVIWGPVRAADIPAFLEKGMKADASMRRVTFTLRERTVLVPVEITLLWKSAFRMLLILFLLSGFGPGFFSFSSAWVRGLMGTGAMIAGIMGGAVIAPILLPWLPGRAFSLKGLVSGAVCGLPVLVLTWQQAGFFSATGLFLFTVVLSSYLSMNFTGSTPYTSPSGVEKEMRKAIPLQALGAVLSAVLWIGGAFTA